MLSEVIPAMDIIDEALTDESIDVKYQPAIRAAVNLAKKTLNRYYGKSDASETYRIAMSTSFHLIFILVCLLTLSLL